MLDWPFVIPEKELVQKYNYAGILVTSTDLRYVLLGSPKEAPSLWGNFAGARNKNESDPRITATRELREEAGLGVNYETLNDPLIIIKNAEPSNPRVGIVYLLPADNNVPLVVPPESEIETLQWYSWDKVCELMDEHRPDLRLWGGQYTSEALYRWIYLNNGREKHFGGIVQIDYGYLGTTPFKQLKMSENT